MPAAADGRWGDPAIPSQRTTRHGGISRQLQCAPGRPVRHSRALGMRKVDACSKRSADTSPPSRDEFTLNGAAVHRPGPDRVFVFQEFDQLLPWKTVKQNIAFALTASGRHPRQRGRRARDALHRQGQSDEVRRQLSAYAVGRHEAARGDRARAWRWSRKSC